MIASVRQMQRLFGLALGAAMLCPGVVCSQPATQTASPVIAADNRLGLELYRRLAEKPGNIVVSPHSIATAMAMAHAGARGETAKEMDAVLHIDLPANQIADTYRALTATLNSEAAAGGPLVQVSNALHLTRFGEYVAPGFKQFLADRFAAEVFAGSDLAAINGWVKQRTNGRIEKILTKLDPNSVCVILNAIYFKGTWLERFNVRNTRPDDFHLASGESIQVPSMHQSGYFQVVRAQSYDAIRLRYSKSSLAMIVVVPTRIDGLSEMEAALDTQSTAAMFAQLAGASTGKVDLSLPRFKIEFGADLIPQFQNLGMQLAFNPDRADFTGITESTDERKRIHISQIQHRAFIDVNEDGTEAAAATAVEFAARAAPGQPTVFKVDRPFLYFIADETSGAILFIGRVMDPRGNEAPRL